MDVAQPEFSPQAVTVAAKAKEGVEAILPEMAVVGHALLFTVCLGLDGIDIDNQPPLTSLPQERITGAKQRIVQTLHSTVLTENVVLKP